MQEIDLMRKASAIVTYNNYSIKRIDNRAYVWITESVFILFFSFFNNLLKLFYALL